jgi:DNA-directed RNA polymerase beta' subunit
MQTAFINLQNLYDPNRVITSPQPLTKDKKFNPDGVYSEVLFGKKNDSEMISYHCECGKYKGKFLEGYVCEDCKTEVKKAESMLDKLAWIDLGRFYIINPVFYFLIAKLAGGPTKLNHIISYDKNIDRDGNVLDSEKGEYDNIGLMEFKKNFFVGKKLLLYFYENSKSIDRDDILNTILKNHDKIFISHIPVFDTSLRPATVTMKDKLVFKFDEINNSYNFIIKLSNIINKENSDFELVILPNLYNIQQQANTVFNKITENLASKEGFIRSKLLGNRVNFSARNVITPMFSGYDICDFVIPYMTFVELYSFHLTNLLSKLKGISLANAQRVVTEAQSKFDPTIYKLCLELVHKTKNGCTCLINRNPTIARGSILYLRIAHVKPDYTDLTTSIHNSLLRLLAGDYDGDVINIFPVFDNEYKKAFYDTFSPDRLFISNNNGSFNNKLSLDRDQVIGMYQFNK